MIKPTLISQGFLTASVIVLCTGPGLLWSQSKPVSTVELAKKADVVVVGKVSSLNCEWKESRTRIQTRVAVTVDNYLKGNDGGGGGPITLLVPGGEVGVEGEIYSDMPQFQRDEEVVVFAQREKNNNFRVSSGHAGKFTIERDRTTGKAVMSDRMTLEEFTTQIKNAMKVQKLD